MTREGKIPAVGVERKKVKYERKDKMMIDQTKVYPQADTNKLCKIQFISVLKNYLNI